MSDDALRIYDRESLASAVNSLRDGRIDIRSIVFDAATQRIVVPVWQPDFSLASARRLFCVIWRRCIPLRCWELIFDGASAWNCDYGAEGERLYTEFTLGDVEWNGVGTIAIRTHDGVSVLISARSLDGCVRPTEETDATRALSPFTISFREPVAAK